MTLPLPPVLAAAIMELNPGLTLWTAITFLVLIAVLAKWGFGPIVRMLDERERVIHEAIDEAKRERAEAQRMLAEQTSALEKAQLEAATMAQRSRQEVEALRASLTAQARKEAEDLVAAARRQIQDERAKAVAELRAQVADLAIAAAGRIVRASLDESQQRALVQEFIAGLPADRAA